MPASRFSCSICWAFITATSLAAAIWYFVLELGSDMMRLTNTTARFFSVSISGHCCRMAVAIIAISVRGGTGLSSSAPSPPACGVVSMLFSLHRCKLKRQAGRWVFANNSTVKLYADLCSICC